MKCLNCSKEGNYKVMTYDNDIIAHLCEKHMKEFVRFLKYTSSVIQRVYKCGHCGHTFVANQKRHQCSKCKNFGTLVLIEERVVE